MPFALFSKGYCRVPIESLPAALTFAHHEDLLDWLVQQARASLSTGLRTEP